MSINEVTRFRDLIENIGDRAKPYYLSGRLPFYVECRKVGKRVQVFISSSPEQAHYLDCEEIFGYISEAGLIPECNGIFSLENNHTYLTYFEQGLLNIAITNGFGGVYLNPSWITRAGRVALCSVSHCYRVQSHST